jgi:hypothetical protein
VPWLDQIPVWVRVQPQGVVTAKGGALNGFERPNLGRSSIFRSEPTSRSRHALNVAQYAIEPCHLIIL